MFRQRILPVILVLLVSMPATAVLMALLYSNGLPATLSLAGTLTHLPVIALLAGLLSLILVRLKKLSRETAGFRFNARSWVELLAGALIAVASVVVCFVGFHLLTGRAISLASPPPASAILLWGLPAFIANAAIQQLPLQSMILAASDGGKKSVGPIVLGTLFFMGLHITAGVSVTSLANDALFGLITCMAFFRTDLRSYALPIGFHGGWNFAQTVLVGSPTNGEPNHHALLRWPTGAEFWTGGTNGLDSGALFTLALLPALLFLLRPNTPESINDAPKV